MSSEGSLSTPKQLGFLPSPPESPDTTISLSWKEDSIKPQGGPSTPKQAKYLPSPPESPETIFRRPRGEEDIEGLEERTIPEHSVYLSAPTESPEVSLRQQRGEDNIESPDSSSIVFTPATEPSQPVTTALDSLEEHLGDDSSREDSEELQFEGFVPPRTKTNHKLFRLLVTILAPKKARAQARAARSRVANVFRLIVSLHEGHYVSTRSSISRGLSPDEYQDLLARVEADEELNAYFYSKLRFDYSSVDNRFTIYMVTRLHEHFGTQLSFALQRMVGDHTIESSDSIIQMLKRDLCAGGSPALQPKDLAYNGKIPDGVLQFPDTEYPSLVIEIGWSQKKQLVEDKAKYYLENFNGQIRTVISINLSGIYNKQDAARKEWERKMKKYEKGQGPRPPELTFLVPQAIASNADFSIWRGEYVRRTGKAKISKKTVQNQVFQTSYQQPNEEVSLQLSFEDFISHSDIDKFCEQEGRRPRDIKWPQVELSSKTLCDIFAQAVGVYRRTYLSGVQRQLEKRRQEGIDAEAARRREATEPTTANSGPGISGLIGRFRDRSTLRRPERYR